MEHVDGSALAMEILQSCIKPAMLCTFWIHVCEYAIGTNAWVLAINLAETCGLDDVFLPDDLSSGPKTQLSIYA